MQARGRLWPAVKLALLLAVPAIFALVPTSIIENGPSLCVYRRVLGIECPGCGMTRAFSHFAHGHITQGLAYNKLAAVAFPLAAGIWAIWAVRLAKEIRGGIAHGH